MNKMILCTDTSGGIGFNNTIPWHSTEDFKHFKNETLNAKVLMGYKTWLSLPDKFKPLSERLNIVVTNREVERKYKDHSYSKTNLIFISEDELESFMKNNDGVIVIGGAYIYNKTKSFVDCIIKSTIAGDYTTDTKIDLNSLLSGFNKQEMKYLQDGVKVEYFYRYGV